MTNGTNFKFGTHAPTDMIPEEIFDINFRYVVKLKFCVSTNELTNGFIPAFTGQCLMLCVALRTSRHWSTSIGRRYFADDPYLAEIYAYHWTNQLYYVCQYHSKSVYGQSLSVYQSVDCHWIN